MFERKIFRIPLLFGLLGFSFIFTPILQADQFEIWTEHPDTLYRFHDHLLEAETSLSFKSQEPLIGKWNKDRFYFRGLSPRTQIKLVEEQHEEEKGKAIRFNPVERARRRLIFNQVPPGSRLDFYYKVSAGPKTEPSPYLLLKIFIGKHLVKSMRIFPDEKKWKKEEIDLGVVSFLAGNTIVTFEVSSDFVENLLFTFEGEVKQ